MHPAFKLFLDTWVSMLAIIIGIVVFCVVWEIAHRYTEKQSPALNLLVNGFMASIVVAAAVTGIRYVWFS
jgi:TRAP-type C4-dicarboxylate transport system permease small subunit